MKNYEKYIDSAIDRGAEDAWIISANTIEVANWVRWKCRYGCYRYGENLACPPNTPWPFETEELINEYDRVLLIMSHDNSSMQDIVVDLEYQIFLDGYHKAFGLACGPCERCEECGPECPEPERVRPSLEASGIDVYTTVRNNGREIEVLKSEEERPDYYAMVLIE
ncbi:MAG: DUF2284 domain-containing protein [Bacillota bacterium]